MDKALGRMTGEVRTAVPMTDDEKQRLSARLGGRIGKEVVLEEVVDRLAPGRLRRPGRQPSFSTAASTGSSGACTSAWQGIAHDQAEEISEIIKRQLQGYEAEIDLKEAGRVIEVGDGIARIHGLESAMSGELLGFPAACSASCSTSRPTTWARCCSATTAIKEGDRYRTTRIAQVPVGEALVGRVVNALGQPVDGKGPIDTTEFRPIERYAPGMVDRRSVKEPLQTGLKAIDTMIPIGRGQRELIIGDRGTGKTAIGIDTIINQKGQGVFCFYVAIGEAARRSPRW